jgi:hypothetical protein
VEEEEIAKQEQQKKQHHDEEDDKGEERRRQRVELTRPRTSEPMGLGMSHISLEDDDEPRRRSSPIPSAVRTVNHPIKSARVCGRTLK